MERRPRPAVVETHRSTLFFYGDKVFKVRRPVARGATDFRLLDRRQASCEREVALNRGLARDVYLGTATIAADGMPVEHAVVMRRLAKDRNLAVMAQRRRGLENELEGVASVLAGFHAAAERSARIDAAATGRALWQRWQAVEEAMDRFVGRAVDARRSRELLALARQYVDGRDALFHQRIAEGAVCDGHGDLEAADVFILDDGPRILDRLEADEEGRFGDVLADVGSLVQDLEIAGDRAAADSFVDAYRRCAGREHPASLLHFYVAQRAHTRLLQQCLRQEDGLRTLVPPAVLIDQALAHLRAALPRLVLVGGLPGSGTSTLAGWMGPRLGADVLSLQAPDPGSAEPEGGGSSARTGRPAYERLCDQAAARLAAGRSVVLDAPWSTEDDRRLAEDTARRASAPFVAVQCEGPHADAPPDRDAAPPDRDAAPPDRDAAPPDREAAPPAGRTSASRDPAGHRGATRRASTSPAHVG